MPAQNLIKSGATSTGVNPSTSGTFFEKYQSFGDSFIPQNLTETKPNRNTKTSYIGYT
jgi:hypothetical protein